MGILNPLECFILHSTLFSLAFIPLHKFSSKKQEIILTMSDLDLPGKTNWPYLLLIIPFLFLFAIFKFCRPGVCPSFIANYYEIAKRSRESGKRETNRTFTT